MTEFHINIQSAKSKHSLVLNYTRIITFGQCTKIHLFYYKISWFQYICSKIIPYLARVPILAENTYRTHFSSIILDSKIKKHISQ